MHFVDLDSLIEDRAKMPVARVFEVEGETGFRRLEHESLRALCLEDRNLVVATGGGTAVFESNRALMRASGLTIWLDPAFEVILERLDEAARSLRPLFGCRVDARQLFDERQPAYSAADMRVCPRTGETVDETAESILRLLSDKMSATGLGGAPSAESP